MRIYHIKRLGGYGYDDYSDAVVVASTAAKARLIHPGQMSDADEAWQNSWVSRDLRPNQVVAVLIGEAKEGLYADTVICASFHAEVNVKL